METNLDTYIDLHAIWIGSLIPKKYLDNIETWNIQKSKNTNNISNYFLWYDSALFDLKQYNDDIKKKGYTLIDIRSNIDTLFNPIVYDGKFLNMKFLQECYDIEIIMIK